MGSRDQSFREGLKRVILPISLALVVRIVTVNKPVIALLQSDTNPLIEVAALTQLCREVRTVDIGDQDFDPSEDAGVRMVIIQQSRRRPYSNASLQKLRRRYPFALFVSVNGRWNEGAKRSGAPYAGFIHVRSCEAIHRIRRLIGGLQHHPHVMGEYRPLFSAREALNWWLRIGTPHIPKMQGQHVRVYGHRDATGGIARAFNDSGWNVEQLSFRCLTQIKSAEVESFHQEVASLVVVGGRMQVRQLVQARLLQHIDLLVADNITRHERDLLGKEFQCQVIAKPFQNDDLIEALGSVPQGTIKKAA